MGVDVLKELPSRFIYWNERAISSNSFCSKSFQVRRSFCLSSDMLIRTVLLSPKINFLNRLKKEKNVYYYILSAQVGVLTELSELMAVMRKGVKPHLSLRFLNYRGRDGRTCRKLGGQRPWRSWENFTGMWPLYLKIDI